MHLSCVVHLRLYTNLLVFRVEVGKEAEPGGKQMESEPYVNVK